MGPTNLRYAIAAMVMLLCTLLPLERAVAGDAVNVVKSSCRAAGDQLENLADVARAVERWDCDGGAYSLKPEITYLNFDLQAGADVPRYLLTRRAALRGITYMALDAEGHGRAVHMAPDTWENSRHDGTFRVLLAGVNAGTRQVIIAFESPSHDMTLEAARLVAEDLAEAPDYTRKLLILAMLCGVLATPLLFNVAFYRVLREPFVLWHSALVITLLGTVGISSGLAASFFDVPVMTLSWMATVIFGLSVSAGSMFTHGFVEKDRLHPVLRRALLWIAVASVTLSILHAAFPFVGRPIQSPLYTAAFLPIMLVFILCMVDALRRGSRAAKFQAIGWSPMVIVGWTRLVTGVVPSLSNQDAMMLFYCACVVEVLCTALGVADRFMSLKDQRDRARTEAEVMERLAQRDPLTGLLNRRAMTGRFDALVADGFTTMAVLDLDHFKAINDVYGHGVGDAVLKVAAQALRPNEDVQAFRIGGEEFLMLLRGDNGAEQAEKRRRAISPAVGRAKLGMAQRVTSSMGVVQLQAGPSGRADFAEAFERADRLLYQAKISGRDQAVFEDDGSRDEADEVQHWAMPQAEPEARRDARMEEAL